MAFTHVLIPTDFSVPAQQAVRYALEEATLHHAKSRFSTYCQHTQAPMSTYYRGSRATAGF